jgi:quercetin dioxygenase-like cupin family protein
MDRAPIAERHRDLRTHGSPQREPRDLLLEIRDFDAASLASRLAREPAFETDGRNSQTVHDDGFVRVLVSVVAAGRDIGAQRSEGYVTLTVVDGQGRMTRGPEPGEAAAELRSGTTVILAPGAPWSYRAETMSTLVAYFWAFDGAMADKEAAAR